MVATRHSEGVGNHRPCFLGRKGGLCRIDRFDLNLGFIPLPGGVMPTVQLDV
jgi:hypothetical protein